MRIGLSRVGVTGVSKAIRLSHAGKEKLISAQIECTVDLDANQFAAQPADDRGDKSGQHRRSLANASWRGVDRRLPVDAAHAVVPHSSTQSEMSCGADRSRSAVGGKQ